MLDIITGTNNTDEEDAKPSLKLKRIPCKQQESDDSEDVNVGKASHQSECVFLTFQTAKMRLGKIYC